MFTIKKVFNNNIAYVIDEASAEFILLGRGLAFQKKGGDLIDSAKIEKTFRLESEEINDKFSQLFRDVPLGQIELSVRIIEEAQKTLNKVFDDQIFISISDHISFALKRAREGLNLPNALLWEVMKFYPDEYAAALVAVERINYYENVTLSESEAGFIALHFVNADTSSDMMEHTVETTETIHDILKIVQLFFNVEFDEKSLNYIRFVSHIKYFVDRILNNTFYEESEDSLFDLIVAKYPKEHLSVNKIENYIKKRFGKDLRPDEKVYFIIHVNRVVNRK